MRLRITSFLGITTAVLTLLIALLVPLKLMGGIATVVAKAGFHIDPVYDGGAPLRTVAASGYTLTVHAPVHPHWLQRGHAFQQVSFAPVSKMPAHVDLQMDMDGDGQPDLRIVFDLPADPNAPLHGSVQALNGKFHSVAAISNNSFTELLARTGDRVVLRVPLAE